jgi:hypothetical protein
MCHNSSVTTGTNQEIQRNTDRAIREATGGNAPNSTSPYLQFQYAYHSNISVLAPRAPREQFPKASPDSTMEGTMTKEFGISLIAAAALFGMAMLSIASAADGRIAFDNQPDAMVTQLYATNVGTGDRPADTLASNVRQSGYHVSR